MIRCYSITELVCSAFRSRSSVGRQPPPRQSALKKNVKINNSNLGHSY